jgi:NAD(P)-dependent dehydrogenase (short-subunit alcohol dehydrogenase family)
MQDGGSIVNVGSVLALTSFGLPQAAYTASKSGLIGLTRDLAQQWAARRHIRVNLVAPGLFPTEMLDEFRPGFADDVVAARVPMRRTGLVEECAAAVLFLASAAASYITGVVLPVDGGLMTS